MTTKKKPTAKGRSGGTVANGLATHAVAAAAPPPSAPPEAVRAPVPKAQAKAPKKSALQAKKAAPEAAAKAAAPKKASKRQPKTVRSATPPAPAQAAPEPEMAPLPPMPEGPTISGSEEAFLAETNDIMTVIRAGLSVLPEPEDHVQRMQALYFGFLNTTVQLGLDLGVPVDRMIDDMAECMTRADLVRASEAELAAIEAQQ